MGCDIHPVLEKWDDDQACYVGVHGYEYFGRETVTGVRQDSQEFIGWVLRNRDYDFFWVLANVRGPRPEMGPGRPPRGFPDDASTLACMYLGNDPDLHSHSWCSMDELAEALDRAKSGRGLNEVVADRLVANHDRQQIADMLNGWLGVYIEVEELDKYRLVFAFDN